MNAFHQWFCRSTLWRHAVGKLLPWALEDVDLGPELLEIGAGPGIVTGHFRIRGTRVTAVEIDSRLGASLGKRMRGTDVRVVQADGTQLPFADASFTGSVCFTMLHHIPSKRQQNRLLDEVHRVLKPRGVFAGTDSRWSRGMQLIHIGNTMVTIDPATFAQRMTVAGFVDVRVNIGTRAFRFFGRRP